MNSTNRFASLFAALLAAVLVFSQTPAQQSRRKKPARRASAPATRNEKPSAPKTSSPESSATEAKPAQTYPSAEGGEAKTAASANSADFEDKGFPELFDAEAYAVCIEIQSLGRTVKTKEFEDLEKLFAVMISEEAEAWKDITAFYETHAERLENVKAYAFIMPARKEFPFAVGGLEFQDVETAKLMEPLIRAEWLKVTEKTSADKKGEKGKKGAQVSANKGGGRNKATARNSQPQVSVRRLGRLIITTDKSFKIETLRSEGAMSLADDTRFKSLRSRFSTESLFIYLDVAAMMKVAERESEETEAEWKKAEERARISGTVKSDEMEAYLVTGDAPDSPDSPPPAEASEVEVVGEESPPPAPIADGSDERMIVEGEAAVSNPSFSDLGFLYYMFYGGLGTAPQWPEAVGFGTGVEDGKLVVRALMVNDSGQSAVHPIPFLPFLVGGPQIVTQAASLVPSDTEIYVSASLDLVRIFQRTLDMQREFERQADHYRVEAGEKESARTPEQVDPIAAFEKLVGFRIVEDFLPAFGNEIAVSVPLDWFGRGMIWNAGLNETNGKETKPKEEDEDDEASPLLLVSLNDAAGVQRMLPQILNFIMPGGNPAQSQEVKHDGVEIHSFGGFALAYAGNFLVVSENANSIKRFLDEVSTGASLANEEEFRDASDWKPRQKLGEIYVSRYLLEDSVEKTKYWLDPNDAEAQKLLESFDIRPAPISYSLTQEGGGELFHELHLPVAYFRLFAAQAALGKKIAPLEQGEMTALQTLASIRAIQNSFKKSKGSYAALDELSYQILVDENKSETTRPFTKDKLDKLGYRFEQRVAGDRYTVSATPKEYGKSGLRSFFMDESGVIRVALRGGEPATANDPPID